MGLNIGSLLGKAFTWLVPRVADEVQKEIERRTAQQNIQQFGVASTHEVVRQIVASEFDKRGAA